MENRLFDDETADSRRGRMPLAARIRPQTADDFVGQKHLIGEHKLFSKLMRQGSVHSMILWGPPGSGKTTLALLIARQTNAEFLQLSAVSATVADIRRSVEKARKIQSERGVKTILFLDEIHRFSKSQQDTLLPYVEDGTLTLVGATTENPSFEVIPPLLSRAHVYVLKSLSEDDLRQILGRALSELKEVHPNLELSEDAASTLLKMANGDARKLLNTLQVAADYSMNARIDTEILTQSLQIVSGHYRAGEAHYDTISAFIKSVRASDPDAALYYLARMIYGNEDPLFIARRLVILAAEDIGLANPYALSIAVAAQQAVHLIGMPEGRIILSECTIYLATCPKSNSAYKAIGEALKDVPTTLKEPIPPHLLNAPTKLMKELGYGKGYKYAHDFPEAYVEDCNLPDKLKGRKYYHPADNDNEKRIKQVITQRHHRHHKKYNDKG